MFKNRLTRIMHRKACSTFNSNYLCLRIDGSTSTIHQGVNYWPYLPHLSWFLKILFIFGCSLCFNNIIIVIIITVSISLALVKNNHDNSRQRKSGQIMLRLFSWFLGGWALMEPSLCNKNHKTYSKNPHTKTWVHKMKIKPNFTYG